MVNKKLYWMNIKDKEDLEEPGLYCPPHYFPHKLPDGNPIIDEPCHTHQSKLRMIHHSTFCKMLKCPNYEKMIKVDKERRSNKK